MEELAKCLEETLLAKKHGAYLIALFNVGKMERSESFLEECEDKGPKTIGILSVHRQATSQKKPSKLLAPLITDATKGSRIHSIMQDLQIMATDKLLTYVDGFYLVALQEAGANGLIQWRSTVTPLL